MTQLWQQVPLEEGTPVVYLGVHAVRWQPEWGEPAIAFNRVEMPRITMHQVSTNEAHTRLSVFVSGVHAGIITALPDEAEQLLKIYGGET